MPVATDERRKQLVGLSVAEGEAALPTGAHVVTGQGRSAAIAGLCTSSYASPSLGRPVALGLVEGGLKRIGEPVGVYWLGAERRAAIAPRSRSIPKGSGSMREMRWPPARGGAGLLIDAPRLGAAQKRARPDLDLRRSRSGGAALAPGAPMLGLYALKPEGAHALRIGRSSALLVSPAPLAVAEGWREGWCARASTTAGRRSTCRAPTRPGAGRGDLGRP